MASIQDRRKEGRGWRVLYRDPDGKQRSRSFAKWAEADAFASTVETDKLRGEYQDPPPAGCSSRIGRRIGSR